MLRRYLSPWTPPRVLILLCVLLCLAATLTKAVSVETQTLSSSSASQPAGIDDDDDDDFIDAFLRPLPNPHSFVSMPLPDPKSDATDAQITWRRFSTQVPGARQFANAFVTRNPRGHVSVTPPEGGCGVRTDPVLTSRARNCRAVINGGFFNTHTSECINGVVSEGRTLQPAAHRNVHFGVTSNGFLFMGHLTGLEDRLPDVKWASANSATAAHEITAKEIETRAHAAEVLAARAKYEPYPANAAKRWAKELTALRPEGPVVTADEVAVVLREQDKVLRAAPLLPGEKLRDRLYEYVIENKDRAAVVAAIKAERRRRRGLTDEDPAEPDLTGFSPHDPLNPATTPVTAKDISPRAPWFASLSPQARSAFPHAGLTGDRLRAALLKDKDWRFDQLLGGIVWLVRGGRNVCPTVDECARGEDMSAQESGGNFVSIRSARSAVGFTAAGEVLMVTVDGKSFTSAGVDLPQMAEIMMELGAVEAMNLDGGGSATVLYDSMVVNSPSDDDTCLGGMNYRPEPDNPDYDLSVQARALTRTPAYEEGRTPAAKFTCTRPITTIVCVHDDDPAPDASSSAAAGGAAASAAAAADSARARGGRYAATAAAAVRERELLSQLAQTRHVMWMLAFGLAVVVVAALALLLVRCDKTSDGCAGYRYTDLGLALGAASTGAGGRHALSSRSSGSGTGAGAGAGAGAALGAGAGAGALRGRGAGAEWAHASDRYPHHGTSEGEATDPEASIGVPSSSSAVSVAAATAGAGAGAGRGEAVVEQRLGVILNDV